MYLYFQTIQIIRKGVSDHFIFLQQTRVSFAQTSGNREGHDEVLTSKLSVWETATVFLVS